MSKLLAIFLVLTTLSCATHNSSVKKCNLLGYSFCASLPEGFRLLSEDNGPDFVVYNLIREEDASSVYIFEGSEPESWRNLELLERRKSRLGNVVFNVSIFSDEAGNVFALLVRNDIDLPVTIQIDKQSNDSNLLHVRRILAGLQGCKNVQMLGARCRGV